MSRLKDILIFILVVNLLLLLPGCEVLTRPTIEQENEEIAQEGGLPDWLLLSHRSPEEPVVKEKVRPQAINDQEEENEEQFTEPEPISETAESKPEPTEKPASITTPEKEEEENSSVEAENAGEEADQEKDRLTKSQKLLSESWEQAIKDKEKEEEEKDEEEEEEEEENDNDQNKWWDPSTETMTHETIKND